MIREDLIIPAKQLRLGVVGSRGYAPLYRVDDYFMGLKDHAKDYDSIVIISGHADGPDIWAERLAEKYGFDQLIFPIDLTGLPPWTDRISRKLEFTRRAYARNTLIAEACDRLAAFWDGKSHGTLDTMRKVKALGKRVDVVRPDGKLIWWNE